MRVCAEQETTKVLLGVSDDTVVVRYIGKSAGLFHPRREARRSNCEYSIFSCKIVSLIQTYTYIIHSLYICTKIYSLIIYNLILFLSIYTVICEGLQLEFCYLYNF